MAVEKINDTFCWMCGQEFQEGKLKRTFHHSIPRRYNPMQNIKIPIHQECHDRINNEDLIYKRAYHCLKSVFLGFEEKRIKKLEKNAR